MVACKLCPYVLDVNVLAVKSIRWQVLSVNDCVGVERKVEWKDAVLVSSAELSHKIRLL